MNELIKAIQLLIPGTSEKAAKQIIKMLGLDNAEFTTDSDPENENSITSADLARELKSLGYDLELPGMPKKVKKSAKVPFEGNPLDVGETEPTEEELEAEKNTKAIEAVYQTRYGKLNPAAKAIFSDILGDDYQASLYNQEVAFAKYVRGGIDNLSLEEHKTLKMQVFPLEEITKAVVDGGLDVRTIKATQIESQGELGGIAVPPQRQSQISSRLPGLTAVRGNGANIITLVNGNSVEIPQWRSTDSTNRYVGEIRGQWGTETQDPSEQNFKLDMVTVHCHLYTYKVPMSRSLVEDAANVVSKLMEDIALTKAIDEDEKFLTGDGVGNPFGILPDGANDFSLNEVSSQSAAAVTAAGIKALKRGVPSQYRRNAIFVAESDTYSDIEALTAGAGNSNWAFPDLSDEDLLLRRKAVESEAMPSVAADAFAIIFGWMAGYDIVERLGMSIERFHDSGTGINVIEYQVRDRLGGRIEKPWMFSVQKIEA